MLAISAILFAVAAVGGVTLATLHLRNKPRPAPLALAHLLVAAAGLVLLAWATYEGQAGTFATIALLIFLVVALGGFGLLTFRLKRKPLPTPLVLVHGLAAVLAFVLLLIELYQSATAQTP